MVLCLTGFLPSSGMQTVRAEEKEAKIWFKDSEDNADSGKATFVSDKGGIVYASVEKFTVGQGYLIEPTEVSFEAGETYADIIEKLLKANGYTYDAQNTGMGFYLAEIDHADSGVLNIPQCISNMSEDAPTNDKHKSNPYKDTQGLGEFSYSNYSGCLPVIILLLKGKRNSPTVVTYTDSMVNKVWQVMGASFSLTMLVILALSFIVGKCDFMLMLPLCLLYTSIGTAITGLVIREKCLLYTPLVGFVLAIYMLMSYTINNSAAILWNLYFGLSFVVMMIIPGHILNNKSEKL